MSFDSSPCLETSGSELRPSFTSALLADCKRAASELSPEVSNDGLSAFCSIFPVEESSTGPTGTSELKSEVALA